jgi:hypothetical protein
MNTSGLTSFHLKTIALVFMFTEHAGKFLFPVLPENAPLYLAYAGRLVAPVFFFLSVESFFKTSDQPRYIGRLYLFALFMLVGNILISSAVYFFVQPAAYVPVELNVFLSIAVGVSMVAALEWGRLATGYTRLGWFLAAAGLAWLMLATEASWLGVVLFALFYRWYQSPDLYISYAGVCLALFAVAAVGSDVWSSFQWMMIAAMPLIFLYNGERGAYSLKWFFYLFYPAHIWGLYVVSVLL